MPEERRALQRRAYERCRRTAWSVVADRFAALISEVTAHASAAPITRRGPALAGLWAMCDDVGILQDHVAGLVARTPIEDALYIIPIFLKRSEEHTSELQSLMRISYAVFCLKKKKEKNKKDKTTN